MNGRFAAFDNDKLRASAILGGTINLGLQNAAQLVKKFKPTYFVPSHDEDKHAKGLVSKLATTTYATLEEMKATLTDTRSET
jgi:hypothetical protein